ncbi:MAG: acyl-CoA thioesterase domain-containing protein [Dehalococcoidia bacterium]
MDDQPIDEASGSPLSRLLEQLNLERVEEDAFVGAPGDGWRRLFGGHVAAQAVVAAYRTVPEGAIHSLHAYFVRPGRQDESIRYVVHRIRDGRTFTTRDVVAYQSDKAIFNLSCSFAKPEEGVSRSQTPPDVPGPDGLPPWGFPPWGRSRDRERVVSFERGSAIEMRSVDGVSPPPDDMPRRRVWMRVRGTPPEDPAIHAALLTYASDRGFIATAHARPPGATAHARRETSPGPGERPPGGTRPAGPGSSASLDHAIWFHRPPRFDDWLLFTSESPVAHAARALILGQMYRADGVQVASVVQEALVRPAR